MGAITNFFHNIHLKNKANRFDKWTNSKNNYQKAINGDNVKDFKMFKFNPSEYSKNLNEFSQSYIKKYDKNNDGVWSKEEFINMATAGEGIPETDGATEVYNDLFSNLNIDDKGDEISSTEFASFLYTSDVDWDKFRQTGGSVIDSIDGKINYINYQNLSSLSSNSEQNQILKEQKESFYNQFYA